MKNFKTKILLLFFTLVLVVCSAIAFTACGDKAADNGSKDDPLGDNAKVEYTVIYDANGGEFADGETTITQTVKEGETLTAPASPTHIPLAFGGWTTEKGGKTLWKFATDTVTKNITLYAVWEEHSATIISIDGASIDETAMTVFMLVNKDTESVSLSDKVVCGADSVWKLYYDKLGQTEIPTKIAASKYGELENGDNIFYIAVTSLSGSQVSVYKLNVHRSYGILVSYYDSKDNIIKIDIAYTGYEYNVSYNPNIDGYDFNYWKDSNGRVINSVTPYEPVKIYADCTAKTFTATLSANGGTALTDNEKTVTYDKSFTLPTTTRTGYTFTGWYYGNTHITDANGKSLGNWTFASDKTLTAGWQINQYPVTATVNDTKAGKVEVYSYSSGKPSSDGKYNYNSKVTVKATTYSGYTFLGIYDELGNKVNEDEKLYYVTTLGTAAESYTAKWIACPVTVKKNLSAAGGISYDTTTIAGVNTTLTATTNKGYTWLGWFSGETELTKELKYTFVMPSSKDNPATYTAKWKLDERLSKLNFTSTSTTCIITGIKDKTVTEISVPEYVTEIKLGAFSGCSELESITVPFVGGSIKTASDKNQYPFGYIFGTSSYTNGTATQQNYLGNSEYSTDSATYYIPSTLKSVTVTGGNILRGAFGSCNSLKSITIYDGVTSIGNFALSWCTNLTTVTIPDSVTSIGDFAFYKCGSLTDITIPDSVTSVGDGAFEDCTELVQIENGVHYVDKWAIHCDRTVVQATLRSGIIGIANNTFAWCSNLTTVTIPDSVIFIGDNAFYICNSLTSITIPDSVTSIGDYAFDGCGSLTAITISDSVTSIGEWAFSGCGDLANITFNGTIEQWNAIEKDYSWDSNTGNYTIHCKDGDLVK